MTRDDRQKLREAVRDVQVRAFVDSTLSPFANWELQTSNSFRRIGQRGDGDILCGTKHPIDGHPDLLAAPGVLDYIVAAQPRVIVGLLHDLDEAEEKLRQARIICDRVEGIEKKLISMVEVLAVLSTAAAQLADPASDADTVTRARAIVEQLASAARAEAGA